MLYFSCSCLETSSRTASSFMPASLRALAARSLKHPSLPRPPEQLSTRRIAHLGKQTRQGALKTRVPTFQGRGLFPQPRRFSSLSSSSWVRCFKNLRNARSSSTYLGYCVRTRPLNCGRRINWPTGGPIGWLLLQRRIASHCGVPLKSLSNHLLLFILGAHKRRAPTPPPISVG